MGTKRLSYILKWDDACIACKRPRASSNNSWKTRNSNLLDRLSTAVASRLLKNGKFEKPIYSRETLIANWSRLGMLHQLTRTCKWLLSIYEITTVIKTIKAGKAPALTTYTPNSSSHTYMRTAYNDCSLLNASTRKSFQKCGNSPKSLLSSSPVNLWAVPQATDQSTSCV